MSEELMAKLKMLGLPEGMTDAAEIIAWMAEKMPDPNVEVELMADEDKKPEDMAERAEHTSDEMKVEKMEDEVKAEVERQLKAEKVRRSTILNHCKLAKLERSFADELIEDESVTVEIAQERIIRKMASQPLGGAVEGSDLRVTESEHDKFMAAAGAGLVQRFYRGGGIKAQAQAVQGSQDFANLGLYRMAELCVRRMGINPERYNLETRRFSIVSEFVGRLRLTTRPAVSKTCFSMRPTRRSERLTMRLRTLGVFGLVKRQASRTSKTSFARRSASLQTWRLSLSCPRILKVG